MKHVCALLLLFLPCWIANGEEIKVRASVQITDRFGTALRGFLSSNQTYVIPVSLAEVSPWFLAAAVSAEDKRFFSHTGIDVAAVLRAAWQNATAGEVVSGASTITQQVVRAQHPYPKTWSGKIREALQARQTEKNQSKEEILEMYFNWVELGNLTQGVEAASLFYFGVNAQDVSAAQAAFLMGLVKSPTQYNPLKHFSRALKRQRYVLKRMHEEGFLDDESYEIAKNETIELRSVARPFQAPHFTQLLKTRLDEITSNVQVLLDGQLQLAVEKIVKNQLKNLTEENVTNAAVVVVENDTGAILVYVGSGDFYDEKHQGQVDGARALRQPGSSLKPFVYGLAFEKGILTPGALLKDEDTFFEGGFRPRNYDENFHGTVTARQALACSYNIPAVQAAEQVGVANLLTLLRNAGLESLSQSSDFYGLGLALGNGEIRLLELTNAYAALARGGVFKPLLLASKPSIFLPGKTRQILTSQAAYLITDILKDNQARSAAFGLNSPLAVPFEMAAKTGTSKDYKDNFAFGYTPRWTIGVWVGNFDASSMQKVSGVSGAGPILHDVAMLIQDKYPSEPFAEPEGIVRKPVCAQSGRPAGPKCTDTHEELFIQGHISSACDGKHRESQERLQILAPKFGDVYKWDPAVIAVSQRLKWSAQCSSKKCVWTLDGKIYPEKKCDVFWPITPGKHTLSVLCDSQTAKTEFEVLP